MIKGKTRTGFKYELDEARLDDYEIVEMLADFDNDPSVMSKLLSMLMGDDQVKALKEHLRGENGVVSFSGMMNEVIDIFQNDTEVKK